jgi:predicted RNA-binding protein YlxR (DUF448 family)
MNSIFKPLRIYYNNSAAIFMAKNNRNGNRSKHINIKYLAIKKHVKKNKLFIKHINSY